MAEDAGNPTYQGFELQRALENATSPINTLAQGKKFVAIDQLARSRQLQDIASERQFVTAEADRQLNRRMKEKQETDRLNALEEATKSGINLPTDASFADIAKATRERAQDQAEARLDILSAQKADLEERQKNAQQDLLSAAKATGDDTQKRRALQNTLNDATVTHAIPQAKLDYLKSVLSDPTKDPAKAVQQVTDALKEDFGGVNWLTLGLSARSPVMRGTAEANAQNFFTAYQTNLAGIVDPSKQADLATKMAALRDVNVQAESFRSKAEDTIAGFAGVLGRTKVNDWMTKTFSTPLAPPQDPNTVFHGGNLPPPPAPGGNGTPQTPPPPAPLPTTSGTSTTNPQSFEQGGLLGALKQAASPLVTKDIAPGGIGDVMTVANNMLTGSQAGPVDMASALANRVKIDVQQNPNQTLLPATPNEIAQAHQLNASLHPGLTPQQSQQNIAAAMADPAKKAVATASLNALVKVVRAQNAGVPNSAAGQMPNTAPAPTSTDTNSPSYVPEQ